MIEIKFKAQRASGEWVYFTLDGLVNDPRLLAEYSRWKNITQYTEEKKGRCELCDFPQPECDCSGYNRAIREINLKIPEKKQGNSPRASTGTDGDSMKHYYKAIKINTTK